MKAKPKKSPQKTKVTFSEEDYINIIYGLRSELRSLKSTYDKVSREKNLQLNRLEVDVKNFKYREDESKKILMSALSKINTEPSVLLKEQIQYIMQAFFNYIPK